MKPLLEAFFFLRLSDLNMKSYAQLVQRILDEGEPRQDRTGMGTISVFGANLSFDLRERFPLVTMKETRWKTAFLEMLWFLRGECHVKYLHLNNCKLWDPWASKTGYLGPIYGYQWRSWETHSGGYIDQIKELIKGLTTNPHGRRHLVSAWNVSDVPDMALPPCHWAHQCYVSNDGHLDLKLFMRSSDVALGLPFNIAQYALLTHLYARASNLKPRHLIVDLGDAHLYTNQIEPMRKVLAQGIVKEDNAQLVFNTDNLDIDAYTPVDFIVENYHPRAFVPMTVAV